MAKDSNISMTKEQLEALIAQAKADGAKEARGNRVQTISFKVSEKGAVSVYGLQRFPVTLYGEQWSKLLEKSKDLQAFIASNASKLAVKGS